MLERTGYELSTGRGLAALWAGILGPPLVWFAELGVSYPLVYWSCHSGRTLPLYLSTAGALLLVGASALSAWTCLRWVPAGARTDGGRAIDRGRFMALAGLLSSALFGLAILASAIPRWILGPCQP